MSEREPDRREPRREATPLRWTEDDRGEGASLTATQRTAAEELWKLFENYYLDAAPARSRYDDDRRRVTDKRLREIVPVIDDERRSQVLLLDGDRGSGKTALLVTLLDAWSRSAADPSALARDGIEKVCDPRVVPIGLLDLRALPKDTSLLLQISGQLRGLVDTLELGRPCAEPAFSPVALEASEAEQAWKAFQAAAASTEHSMRKRSAELDPESFAAELLETELDRLHLDARFAQLMDRLVEAYEQQVLRKPGQAPVFVLAIDDADMNPARLGECFELLDTLEHPRVVFLLTGVSRLFVSGLRAQFLGELRRPLGRAQLSERERERLEDADEAFRLAERYYDKLVPRNHRFELGELGQGDRIRLVRDELGKITLGGASVAMVFERLPYLGNLLPGHLRAIEDFRLELERCERPIEFLQLIHERVARELEVIGYDKFNVEKLLSPIEGTLFDERALYQVTTRPLFGVGWVHVHTVQELSKRLEAVELYSTVTLSVRLRRPSEQQPTALTEEDEADGPRETFHDHVGQLAILIEYLGPHLEALLGPFESMVGIPFLPPLRARIQLPSSGLFEFSWPTPPDSSAGWRSVEFARLWRSMLDEVVRDGAIDDDTIEFVALNYLAIVIHTATAKLEDDFEPLTPALAERAATWRELTVRLVTKGPTLRFWEDGLLALAHPESLLPAEAAGRLLDAWEEAHAKGPQLLSVEEALASSQQSRWDTLSKLAGERANEITLHAGISERFAEHPWTRRLGALTDEDLLAPLRAALARIPIADSARAPWLPETTAGYLAHRTEALLRQVGPNRTVRVVEAINYWMDQKGNPEQALYRAWVRGRPQDGGYLVEYNDFAIRVGTSPELVRATPLDDKPASSVIAGKQWRIYGGRAREPELEPHVLALFRLIHDFVRDRERGRNRERSRWPLLLTFDEGADQVGQPWPAIAWRAYLDYDAVAERWQRALATATHSADELGRIARLYVHLQGRTYESRTFDSSEFDQPPLAWPALLEFALSRWEENPSDLDRTHAYRDWLQDLERFARRWAALPLVEAAAAFVAHHEIFGVLRIPSQRVRFSFMWGEYAWNPFGATREADRWVHFDARHTHRVIVRFIRDQFSHQAVNLFTPPPARRVAVEALRAALSAVDLPQLPGASSQPNLDAYLSPDLVEHSLQTYTGTLTRVTEAMATHADPQQRLHAAWLAAQPDNDQAMRLTGDQLEVEGSYRVASVLPDLDGNLDLNAQLAAPWPCPAEFGVEYELYRGLLIPTVDERFAVVIHALAHDLVADRLPPHSTFAPIRWPLARVSRAKDDYPPWPAVQWPTRYDRQLQLRAWQLDFERRKDPAAESLTARARTFIAATTHIFDQRTLFQQTAGSWTHVIQTAYEIDARAGRSARTKAFHAWYLQLPRFALPRAGFGERHAADILVRFYDITKLDPRPELIGRIRQVSDKPLELPDNLDDHPAVLVANAQTKAELDAVIDGLRERFELS